MPFKDPDKRKEYNRLYELKNKEKQNEYRKNWGAAKRRAEGKQQNGLKSLADFPEVVAKYWHPFKNGTNKPEDFTSGTRTKVWCQCKEGKWPDGTPADDHVFDMEVQKLTSGYGCPYCCGKRVCKSNSFGECCPEAAVFFDVNKNEGKTPFDFTYGSGQKIHCKCNAGTWPDGSYADDHEWISTPCDLRAGYWCPCCTGNKIVLSNCLATTHPEVSKMLHPTLNGNTSAKDITNGSDKLIWWKCPDKDHAWEATINSVVQGHGCGICGGKKVDNTNSLAALYPDVAKEWHPILNGDSKPEHFTYASGKKAWWACPKDKCGYEWSAQIDRRTRRGDGCPKCNQSHGEKAVAKHLDFLKIKYEVGYRIKECKLIKCLPFDFYLPDFNILIEYHGRQHYEPSAFGSKQENAAELMFEAGQKRDEAKEKYCRDNKIPLLIIPFWEFNIIPNVIDNFLKSKN
jgi:hypothetical protein